MKEARFARTGQSVALALCQFCDEARFTRTDEKRRLGLVSAAS